MKSVHDMRGEVRGIRKRWGRMARRWNDPTRPDGWYGIVFGMEMEWRDKKWRLEQALRRQKGE
jgi:hypothetical protein